MINPWKSVTSKDYEGHMRFLGQDVLLNSIFKQQVSDSSYNTIGIIGIGCGNGLEHVNDDAVVYGYDINGVFLETCRRRYSSSFRQLVLRDVDLTQEVTGVEPCDLMICNLVVEFIGLPCLISLIKNARPTKVSVVLQLAEGSGTAISRSPFSRRLEDLASIWKPVHPEDLLSAFSQIGYHNVFEHNYFLNQDRSFIRMDFSRNSFE